MIPFHVTLGGFWARVSAGVTWCHFPNPGDLHCLMLLWNSTSLTISGALVFTEEFILLFQGVLKYIWLRESTQVKLYIPNKWVSTSKLVQAEGLEERRSLSSSMYSTGYWSQLAKLGLLEPQFPPLCIAEALSRFDGFPPNPLTITNNEAAGAAGW